MSQHAQQHSGISDSTSMFTTPESTTPTRWVGWIWFGASMMILLGLFSLIEGFVALFNDKYYVVTRQGLLVFDMTGWGWVHVIVGGLAVVAGGFLFTGMLWARIIAVILAGVNAIAQLVFLSAYPVWGTIVIALDVLVIYAIIVHGREAKVSE
ncbi:hypothetical protein D5S19_00620 [Amycolatopsis panacis]|uniref:DUF7144 domain-containing protein n=2 Tax=Amycolatopsis panacis TaxID=2340917 RepID=A0A419IBE9_9PSEU|nr:hypothetical protein D5S19_00620 [Amycolatopsis panacis]